MKKDKYSKDHSKQTRIAALKSGTADLMAELQDDDSMPEAPRDDIPRMTEESIPMPRESIPMPLATVPSPTKQLKTPRTLVPLRYTAAKHQNTTDNVDKQQPRLPLNPIPINLVNKLSQLKREQSNNDNISPSKGISNNDTKKNFRLKTTDTRDIRLVDKISDLNAMVQHPKIPLIVKQSSSLGTKVTDVKSNNNDRIGTRVADKVQNLRKDRVVVKNIDKNPNKKKFKVRSKRDATPKRKPIVPIPVRSNRAYDLRKAANDNKINLMKTTKNSKNTKFKKL